MKQVKGTEGSAFANLLFEEMLKSKDPVEKVLDTFIPAPAERCYFFGTQEKLNFPNLFPGMIVNFQIAANQ